VRVIIIIASAAARMMTDVGEGLDNDFAAIVLSYLSVMTMGWKVAGGGAWRRKHTN